jgi:hypothetical protein
MVKLVVRTYHATESQRRWLWLQPIKGLYLCSSMHQPEG